MKHQRKFIIKYSKNITHIIPRYVYRISKLKLGYYCMFTSHIQNAKTWKYKKNCEKICEKLYTKYDPTKTQIGKDTLEVIEITDKETLRYLKLKKLKKHEIQSR